MPRNAKRFCTALLVAALISYLLYQTQWPALRPGLTVLLAGQLLDALALLWRGLQPKPETAEWLQAELRFTSRLARADTIFQTAGFALLGYALWTSTQNLLLALAIGVLYPLTAYFGMTRPRNAAIRRKLEKLLEEGSFSRH